MNIKKRAKRDPFLSPRKLFGIKKKVTYKRGWNIESRETPKFIGNFLFVYTLCPSPTMVNIVNSFL